MLKNLSIRAILTFALIVFVSLFLISGVAGYRLLDQNRQSIQLLLDNNLVRTSAANSVASELLRVRFALLNAMARLVDDDRRGADVVLQRLAPYMANANEQVGVLKSNPDLDAEGKPLFDDMLAAYAVYRSEAIDPVVSAMQTGNVQQASSLNDQKLTPLGAKFTQAIAKYTAYTDRVGQAIAHEASRQIGLAMIGIAIILGILLFVALGLYLVFSRAVFGPMREAARLFDRIAAGDLTANVSSGATNEIGMLYSAVARMQGGLTQTVSAVRRGVQEIHTGTREIAAGNMDLSARTEQQAASLEETASSMEELSSTVKLNADSALRASQLAGVASEVAVTGGHAVGEVVGTMRAISDSSRRIAEIVGVIDGIAFQTNILALNAAVEAARAGEQGKGFAVVASEVRSLAQRSGQAAKEIKGLIDDSVQKVSIGSNQVETAGTTMQQIVQSVKRVADIIGEISAASTEQAAGIQQVNLAVSQMDSVTQQNAALVEEAAASAASLAQQADDLRDAVSVFRLAEDSAIQSRAERPAASTPLPYVTPFKRLSS